VAFIWTLLADSGAVLIGMAGRVLLGGDTGDMSLFGGSEAVLPALVEFTFPALLVGLYVAIVLSAIMSTVDSLLVLAASAAVRDWYQKVRNPQLADESLVSLSRKVTFVLALVGLCIALAVAISTPDRTVFWFVIFGWSGISATFCPVMILSLFWSGMTRNGVLAGMGAGFCGVPLFKFVAPHLPGIGPFFESLSELPPSFALSFMAAVAVSMMWPASEEVRSQAKAALDEAKA
jgi:Na+/proline symporter